MFTDFVLNGAGHGEVGQELAGVRFDPGMLRPFRDRLGRPCVTINTGKMLRDDKAPGGYKPERKTFTTDFLSRRYGMAMPTVNATSLRKEEWIHIDQAVVRATRQRLRAWTDLMATSSLGGFNAMSKLTHEYEAMSDPGEAVVDMDALSDNATDDTPLFKLRSIPLPITHSDFWFSERKLAVSRNTGTPLDTTMAEAAGRRVAEMIEKTLVGTVTGLTFGAQTTGITAHDTTSSNTSRPYGYTNFPFRVTKTDLTTPDGTNPEAVYTDVIEMRETQYTNGFFGPFILYHSTSYDQYLDRPFFVGSTTNGLAAPNQTLRRAIEGIEGISAVRRLDFLTSGYQMVLIQMTSDVAQAINGMGITTVQWDTHGGLKKHFKVMAIQVGLLKAPYNGTAGIVHGTTS